MSVKRIGSKVEVYNGTAKQTSGGLKKKDLVRVKKGNEYRIKSKKQQAIGKKNVLSQQSRQQWTNAMKKGRKQLIKEGVINKHEFIPLLKRKSSKYNDIENKKGKELYKRVREIYDETK